VRVHLPGTRLELPAPEVAVVDTVGAGDAFTAALLDGVLSGRGEPDISERALELSAWVATQPGAMPPWTHGLRVRFASA
jgi:fructokinase